MLKEKDIQDYVTQQGWSFADNSSIVGVNLPGKLIGGLLGPIAVLSMKYMALYFGDDGIAVMPLSNVTGDIEQKDSLTISKDSIHSIQFQKKLLSYQLIVKGEEFELHCKVNKTMVGAPWHKASLTHLLERYQ